MRKPDFNQVPLTERMRVRYERKKQVVELTGTPTYKGKDLIVFEPGIKVYRTRIRELIPLAA